MIARTRAQSVPIRPTLGISGRQIVLTLMTVALTFIALGLLVVGLDAVNDVLARGFSSIANPVS